MGLQSNPHSVDDSVARHLPKVSTSEPYYVGDADAPLKVAALDLGIKKNILLGMGQVIPSSGT